MKKLKKRWTGLFLALACLMSLLPAVPVRAAELSETVVSQLQNEVQLFLEPGSSMGDFFNLPEETYDQLRETGGFYEIAVDAWENVREETGSLVSIGETEVTLQDDTGMIQCTTPAEFENYSADVVISFTADEMNPSNFVITVDYPLSRSLEDAGISTATGLIIVFAILFFLCGVIYLIRYVNPDRKNQNPDSGTPRQKREPVPAAAPVSVPAAAAEAPADEIETAIVLAAAIAAAEADEPSGDGYVVRSIRKVKNKNWKRV